VLQAFVTESVKPVLDCVVTFGAGHFYVSQSDKGGLVFGGAVDGYNSYAQRGHLPMVEEVLSAGVTLMPALSRLRVLRQWGGLIDMSMDGSPIVSKTPVDNLYINGGWCYGGFKAVPAGGMITAHLVANDAPHPLGAHFGIGRFRAGRTIDERGVGPYPWAHESEFRYRGDADQRRPAGDAPADAFLDYVYMRDNPAGPHAEWWHHVLGCRQVLRIVRDTRTHAVTRVTPARPEGGT
jgi:heterotetrameric sarcosine oxidase delta subunit